MDVSITHVTYKFLPPIIFSAHLLNSVFSIIYICCHYACSLTFSLLILFTDVQEKSFQMILWGHVLKLPFAIPPPPRFDKSVMSLGKSSN